MRSVKNIIVKDTLEYNVLAAYSPVMTWTWLPSWTNWWAAGASPSSRWKGGVTERFGTSASFSARRNPTTSTPAPQAWRNGRA